MLSYPRNDIIKSLSTQEIPFPFEIFPTKENVPTIRVEFEGRKVFLHSRFKPLEETEKLTSQCDPNSSVIICGGFGLGYLPASLLARSPKAVVIVLEKEPGIIRCALENNPEAETILRNERFFLLTEPQDVITLLQSGISTKSASYYFHRPSVELFPSFYSDFRTLLLTFLQKKNINIATLSRFEKIWARNITKNINCILNDGGVSEFAGILKGAPAVLVCAGPSLDKHIETLRKLKETCLICAVDSAVYRILRSDIMPDIIFTVDPQLLNFYFFFLTRKFKVTSRLVYEPSTYFRIPNGFSGKRHSFDSIFPLIQWVASTTSPKGELDMGGSVSTSAFDLLYRMGAGTITLIGQDMAFSYNKTHASGSLVEYVLLKRNTRTKNLESLSNRLTGSNVIVKIKSNSGKMVNSDRRLLLFYWWFENKVKKLSACKVFTISEEASAIKGIDYLQADELERMIDSSPIKFDRKTLNLPDPATPDLGKFRNETEKTAQSLRDLIHKMNEAVDLAEKAYRAIKTANLSVLPKYVRGMDAIDKYIRERQQENRLIGITMQRVIHSIIEDYEDYLSAEEKQNKDLAAIRKSLLMYTEMKKSAEYNLGLFEGLKKSITVQNQ